MIFDFSSWLNNYKSNTGICQTDSEFESLYKYVLESNKIEGDLVEVGVYEGGTAKLINNFKSKEKKLYLFDTFQGLVDCIPEIDITLKNGLFDSEFKLDYFNEIFKKENVEVVKGYFPNSAPEGFELKKFSLVHIDVDTYESTLNSLNYFYEKMSIGGYIVVHDYNNQWGHTNGVPKAVNEFLNRTQEKIYEVTDSQCSILISNINN